MRTSNKQQDKCPLKILLRHRFVIANEDSVCLFVLCLNGPTVLKKILKFPYLYTRFYIFMSTFSFSLSWDVKNTSFLYVSMKHSWCRKLTPLLSSKLASVGFETGQNSSNIYNACSSLWACTWSKVCGGASLLPSSTQRAYREFLKISSGAIYGGKSANQSRPGLYWKWNLRLKIDWTSV